MFDPTVVIVDDAPAVAQALTQSLTMCGVDRSRIHVAENVVDGRALIEEHAPDLTFMDVAIGNEGGDRLAIELLSEDPTRRIVMVTGLDLNDVRVRDAVSAGAYDVLQKPLRLVRIRELLQLVDSETRGLRRL